MNNAPQNAVFGFSWLYWLPPWLQRFPSQSQQSADLSLLAQFPTPASLTYLVKDSAYFILILSQRMKCQQFMVRKPNWSQLNPSFAMHQLHTTFNQKFFIHKWTRRCHQLHTCGCWIKSYKCRLTGPPYVKGIPNFKISPREKRHLLAVSETYDHLGCFGWLFSLII